MGDKRTITFTYQVIIDGVYCSQDCEYLGKTPAGPDVCGVMSYFCTLCDVGLECKRTNEPKRCDECLKKAPDPPRCPDCKTFLVKSQTYYDPNDGSYLVAGMCPKCKEIKYIKIYKETELWDHQAT